MKCPRCKKENDRKALFCIYCGSSLKGKTRVQGTPQRAEASAPDPSLPGSRFVSLTGRLLRLVPFRGRLAGFMELDQLRRMKPTLLTLPMALTFILGLMQSTYGHIENTPFLFQLMPIISCFNPFLGFLSALTFSVGDFVQKLVVDDVYYSGTKTMEDFIGARVGYIIAYGSVVIYGLLPGVMARVFQRIVQGRGSVSPPGVSGWGINNITGLGHIGLPGACLAALSPGGIPREVDQGYSLNLGQLGGASAGANTLASIIAFAVGGAVGSAIAGAAAIALELPAFYLRPSVDVSCANAMIQTNLSRSIPNSALTGGVGGGATTLVRPPGRPDEPPKKRDEEKEEETSDSAYSIRVTVSGARIKGNGIDESVITAVIVGRNGEPVPGQVTFTYSPAEGGILNVSGNQATLIGAPILKTVTVTVTCSASIEGTKGWFGTEKTPSINVPTKQVSITVVGASPILKLVPASLSLRGDGEPGSCTLVNALIYAYEENELLPEEVAWDLGESLITGKIIYPGANKSMVRVCPEFSEKDGVLTLTAKAKFKLPPLPELTLTESVSFNVKGANPRLDLTASPQKVFGDGEEYSFISGECVLFGEKQDEEIEFQETDKGALERIDKKSVKLTPNYTEKDDSVKVVANVTVGPEDNPLLVEKSVTVTVIGVNIDLVVNPLEVDADEVSQVKVSMNPEDSSTKLEIKVSVEPGDAGKLSGEKPTCYFTPFLTDESREAVVVASISGSSKKVFERRKEIRIIGAAPSVELGAPSQSVKGDGETSIRIKAKTTLFGKEASEQKLAQLNARVEWSHENAASGESLGEFTSKQLTYAEFLPEAALRDGQVKITAKLALVSSETGRVIEAESEPIIIRVIGANPELKLEAEPQTLPGAKITVSDDGAETENLSLLKAKLYVFGEERAFPESSKPRFEVQERSLGSVTPLEEPSQAKFEPGFVARHRDSGALSQTAHVNASSLVKESDIFPGSEHDGEILVKGTKDLDVRGCLIKIVEPGEDTGAKAVDGLMFQVRAVVIGPNGEKVPDQTVTLTIQDDTKKTEETTTAQLSTNRRGEVVYSYTYSGAAASNSGAIQVTAEIRGGNGTRDYDTVSVAVTMDFKPLTLELTATPVEIPGARMLSMERLIESLVEAKIQGPDRAIKVPDSSEVDFSLDDPDLGELEDRKKDSIKFEPFFMARDLDNGKIEDFATVKGYVDVTLSQVREKMPSYSWSSEDIHLESETRINIKGCMVKILEPKDGQNLAIGERGLVEIKAVVSTPQPDNQVGDTVSGVDVKFTLTEKSGGAEHVPFEKTVKTDPNGEAKLEYFVDDAEKKGGGKLTIRAEVRGVRDTVDWYEVTVNILAGLTLTISAAMARVRGQKPELYTPQADQNYTASRVIKLEQRKEES